MNGRSPQVTSRPRGLLRRAVLGCLAAAVVLAPAAMGWADPDWVSPEDTPEPTAEQLADSVRTWEPGGVFQWEPGGVRQWDLEDSVTGLATESEQDSESVITLASDVLFEFGSAQIPPNAADAVTELLAEVPEDATVSISGHTDSIGETALNQELSEQRAAAVAEVVREARPDLTLEVEGFGEDQPVAENSIDGEDNPEGRAKNRRVEIRYDGG